MFKVDAADYMLSLYGNDALRELSSPGKSGSFFYLINDDRYMIKTMKKSEVTALLRMLSAYYNHFRAYENSLVTKYYGLHCVKLNVPAQRKMYFEMLDAYLADEKILVEHAGQTQAILCNDCEKRGSASIHWFYHKCPQCG